MPRRVGGGNLKYKFGPKNPTIAINVKLIQDNKTSYVFTLNMKIRRSVETMRKAIRDRTGVDPSNQVLYFKGRQIEHKNVSLRAQGMYDGCTIECVNKVHS